MSDKYDVVVVGSGPAGASYARVLKEAQPNARVLMVEAGPIVVDPPGRHVRTIKDPRERVAAQFASQGPDANPADHEERVAIALSPSRGRSAKLMARPGTWLLDPEPPLAGETGFQAAALSSNVGGMGSHWSGACPWPGVGEAPADLTPEQLSRALDEARRLLKVTQHAFDGAPLGDQVRQLLAAALNPGRPADRLVQPMPLAIDVQPNGERYWTGSDAILGDLLAPGRDDFELRPETAAKRILSTADVADGVLLYDRKRDREYEVGTRFVVVAADSLRSPQLLFASGIRPAALGHYLNEHTLTTSTIQLDPSLRAAAEGVSKTSEGGVDLLAGVSWVPFDRGTWPFHGQITQWDASPIPVDESFEAWPGSVVECSVFMGKTDVRYEDWVEFDENELDYLGLPKIKVHYTFTDNDEATLAETIAQAERLGGLLGEPIKGLKPSVMPHGASLHYQGTTRFGTDDATSTLDTWMRVRGVDNVYVGGNGTIPTPAACNPTLTNVALATIGAHDLAGRLLIPPLHKEWRNLMFDRYLIRADSLRNDVRDGEVVGFSMAVRHANYRGCFLSLHNGYFLEVDGIDYPRRVQTFEINGQPPRTFEQTRGAVWEHWDYDDEAILHIAAPGGLAPGQHTIRFQQSVLAAYGYLPTDEEWVTNPPTPGTGAGSDKTPQIVTYTLTLTDDPNPITGWQLVPARDSEES